MAGKHLRAMSNSKATKFLKEEHTVLLNLGFRYDSEITVDNPELIDTAVLQGVLFVLSLRSKDFISNTFDTIMTHLENSPIFENSTVKNLIQTGDVSKANIKFNEFINRKYPYIRHDTLTMFHKILSVMFEYFDFYSFYESDPEKCKNFCGYLLEDCYLKTLSYTLLRYFKTVSNEDIQTFNTKVADKNDKEIFNSAKTAELQSECLHFVCEDGLKEDFCKIYNAIRQGWLIGCTDEERENRNKFDNLKDLELKNDWSAFYKLMEKGFYVKPKSVSQDVHVTYSEDYPLKVVDNEKYEGALTALMQNAMSVYELFSLYTMQEYLNRYIKRVLVEKFKTFEQEKSDLLGQIKEFKNTNRSLTRDMNKLNAENEALKKEQEKNQELLEQAKHSEEESKELIELKGVVEELTANNAELTANLSKSENKVSWSDNKIKELEGEIKHYDGVEQSLMALQNENNVLSAEIERIETLEAEEDDSEFERKLAAIKDTPILFVGGVGDMLQKILDLFPNSENITISDNSPNFTIPPRFKYAVLYTKFVKHSFCNRAESLIGRENIIYLNILNKKLVVDELYKSIVGHKN